MVIGEGPWKELAKLQDPQEPIELKKSSLPLLQNMAEISQNNGDLWIVRRLDPLHDLYLSDHRLDGRPVLPAAMAIEFMVEAAQLKRPDWKVISVKDVRVFKGIVLEKEHVELGLLVKEQEETDQEKGIARFEAAIVNPINPMQTFYRATTILSPSMPSSGQGIAPAAADFHPFRTSAKGAYDEWLFHGPRFQCIQKIEGISKQGMIAILLPSSPENCLASSSHAKWLMDPVALDGGLQLVLLWARNFMDITVLPSSFKAVHVYRPFHELPLIRCYLHILEGYGSQSVCCNIYFMDQENQLIGMIERFESTGSHDLNRLTDPSSNHL